MQENWVKVLNEHSEWRSNNDILMWFARLVNKPEAKPGQSAIHDFTQTLCQMRKLVYESHFKRELDVSWLNDELSKLEFEFKWPANKHQLSFPLLRAKSSATGDDKFLESLRGALIIQFALDLDTHLRDGKGIGVQRCEGLFRDMNASKLTTVPEVSDNIEIGWRKEIGIIVEKELESQKEIQRCADLFEASSRSKFCSDACRFSTFQIIKQLKEPNYLAEKQRRYRQKKN